MRKYFSVTTTDVLEFKVWAVKHSKTLKRKTNHFYYPHFDSKYMGIIKQQIIPKRSSKSDVFCVTMPNYIIFIFQLQIATNETQNFAEKSKS